MQSTNQFNGLTMPVFTAFGWAGEETAINYALSQLELFIGSLHNTLPVMVQSSLPVFGLSKDTQSVYLASSGQIEDDAYIAFYARPMSLEIQLIVSDKKILTKGLRKIEKDPKSFNALLSELDSEWALHVQQKQFDEDTETSAHYQDIYKDSVSNMDQAGLAEIIGKAAYLNGEDKWITPIFISRRLPSEQVSAMGLQVVEVVADEIKKLHPLLLALSGRTARKAPRIRAKKGSKKSKAKASSPLIDPLDSDSSISFKPKEQFTYVSIIKPLHLRRGFINQTPKHWPFFGKTARTETRAVTILFDGRTDRSSAVWRLQPDDQARIVLSPGLHEWLEDNFVANDSIRVVATKVNDNDIEILLQYASDE